LYNGRRAVDNIFKALLVNNLYSTGMNFGLLIIFAAEDIQI